MAAPAHVSSRATTPTLSVVEQKLAQFFGAEAALLLPSGYVANLCVFSALPQRGDVVYYDASIHASVKDGLRLSQAQFFSFKHQNTQDLEDKLRRRSGAKTTYVAVEAVYSMSGEKCDVETMRSLCQKHGAHLLVDEAHSSGYLNEGKGLCRDDLSVPVRVHTFGKAWGVQGACLLGSQWLKECMINFARPFIYSTAMTPYQVAAVESTLSREPHNRKLRATLSGNIRHFKKELEQKAWGHQFLPSETPIQYLRVGDAKTCRELSEKLQQENMLVLPILSPTVPLGEEGLRVSLHAFNSQDDISQLVSVLEETLEEPRVV